MTDKNMQLHPDLQSVTFRDVFGTAHTIHVHKDGPFADPADMVAAWENGTIHPFQTHEIASQYEHERGNEADALKFAALAHHDEPAEPAKQGGSY